jgi:hypothetical protein
MTGAKCFLFAAVHRVPTHWLAGRGEVRRGTECPGGAPEDARLTKELRLEKKGGKRSSAYAGCASTVSRGTSRHASSRSN